MGEKVLLVDDEEDLLEAMAERIRLQEMDVTTTTSAWDALEKMETESFDAIVIDLMMPEMDGLKFLRAIKAIKPDLQVILLTGMATVEKEKEATKLGATDLMEKPPDLKRLVQKIRRKKAERTKQAKNG